MAKTQEEKILLVEPKVIPEQLPKRMREVLVAH